MSTRVHTTQQIQATDQILITTRIIAALTIPFWVQHGA